VQRNTTEYWNKIARGRKEALEALSHESEVVRFAAGMALRNMPRVKQTGFATLSQPTEKEESNEDVKGNYAARSDCAVLSFGV